MLFSQATTQFIELRTNLLRPKTIKIYNMVFTMFKDILKDRELNTYTKLDMQFFINARLQKGVAKTSVNIYLRHLKSFGRWCVEMEILQERNAFSTIKQLKVDEKEIEFMTREQFQAVLDAEKQPILRNIYVFGVLTGLRLSTILSLKWNQVDIKNRLLSIENSNTFKTKSGRNQVIPIHPLLIEILNTSKMKDGKYIFAQTRGLIPKPYNLTYVSYSFKKAIRKAGLDDKFHFHSLRKTFGTWMISSGASLYEISKLLGHSNIVVTTMHYASLSTSQLHDVVGRIDFDIKK